MEPISLALTAAASIVSSIITELISGNMKRARRQEIEAQVAIAITRQPGSQETIENRYSRALDEVNLLIQRHPHLAVHDGDVRLSRPALRAPALTKSSRNKLLIRELIQLDSIISSRREELQASMEHIAQPAPSSAPEARQEVVEAPTVNEAPASDEAQVSAREAPKPGAWSREMDRMRDQIRRRREDL